MVTNYIWLVWNFLKLIFKLTKNPDFYHKLTPVVNPSKNHQKLNRCIVTVYDAYRLHENMVAIATESSTMDHDFIKKKTKKSSCQYFITYVYIGICNLLNSDINNSKYPLDFGIFIPKRYHKCLHSYYLCRYSIHWSLTRNLQWYEIQSKKKEFKSVFNFSMLLILMSIYNHYHKCLTALHFSIIVFVKSSQSIDVINTDRIACMYLCGK